MHPELVKLEQQYLELVAELEAGHLNQDDALAVLANLQAIDGDGACWSIDPYSAEFVRTYPGQPPSPADPSTFIPPRLPSPPSPTFEPGRADYPRPGPGDASPHIPPALYPPGPPLASERIRAQVRTATLRTGELGTRVAGTLKILLNGRGRTVGVLAISLLLMILLIANRPSTGEQGAPATFPVAPTSALVADPAGSTASPAPPPAQLPAGPELQGLLAVLTDGSPLQIAAAADFATTPGLRDGLSSLLGAPRAGLRLQAPPAATPIDGRVDWTVTAVDASGLAVRTWTLSLVPGLVGWQIAAVGP